MLIEALCNQQFLDKLCKLQINQAIKITGEKNNILILSGKYHFDLFKFEYTKNEKNCEEKGLMKVGGVVSYMFQK